MSWVGNHIFLTLWIFVLICILFALIGRLLPAGQAAATAVTDCNLLEQQDRQHCRFCHKI